MDWQSLLHSSAQAQLSSAANCARRKYHLTEQMVDGRSNGHHFTARTVEILHKGERIAAHQRMSGNHKHTTVPEHMASSHRRYAGWTIERVQSLVGRAGNKRPLGRSGCGSTNVVKAMAQETCTCGGA